MKNFNKEHWKVVEFFIISFFLNNKKIYKVLLEQICPWGEIGDWKWIWIFILHLFFHFFDIFKYIMITVYYYMNIVWDRLTWVSLILMKYNE